jgi:hypothetical protein
MSEAFETAAAFARQLIDGRGKDTAWTKRARALATAVYQVALGEGKPPETCEARALELLCAPEADLIARIGRSIAVSISMQARLFSRLSSPQRASILTGLRAAAEKRLQRAGDPGGAGASLPDQSRDRSAVAIEIRRRLPVSDEREGDEMSAAEFEAARAFAEQLIPDREEPDAHYWVASGRRLAAAAYLMAGREDGKHGEAREDHARQLLRLPDDELIARLQASSCVTVVMEGKRLAGASARDVAAILAMVGVVV